MAVAVAAEAVVQQPRGREKRQRQQTVQRQQTIQRQHIGPVQQQFITVIAGGFGVAKRFDPFRHGGIGINPQQGHVIMIMSE